MGGLLKGTLGLTISGAVASINDSSNFATNINTGSSTGTISIGNGASTGFTLETGTTAAALFNAATAHTINFATGAAAQAVTVGSGNTTSATTINGGSNGINLNTTLASPGTAGTVVKSITSNSTSAFAIQNAAGTSNLFVADTSNNCVAIRGTCNTNASGAYVPWVSGDANATLNVGSSDASNNQVAVQGTSYSAYGVSGVSTTGAGVAGGSTSNNGLYGYSGSAAGIYASSASSNSGQFQSSNAANTAATLIAVQNGSQYRRCLSRLKAAP